MDDQEDLPSSEISAAFIPKDHGQFAYLSKKMQGNTWMDSWGQSVSWSLMSSQGQSNFFETVVKLNCVESAIMIGGCKKYFFLDLHSQCHSTNITSTPSVSVGSNNLMQKGREIRNSSNFPKYVSLIPTVHDQNHIQMIVHHHTSIKSPG